jgi:H-type small acid-soluble spore protein
MNYDRAQEIVKSTGVIEVFYRSDSVWIEELDKLNKKATVKILNTVKKLDVPLDDLEEGNSSLKA